MECDKKYAYKGALKAHMAIHVKEKLLGEQKITKNLKSRVDMQYHCDKCDYTFDNKRKLNTQTAIVLLCNI